MALTTAGALKAYLEAQGLGISVYRDQAPPGKDLPYVTVREQIALVPDGTTPQFDDGGTGGVMEVAQVDVWQRWRDDSTNALVESPALPRGVAAALKGARLTAAPSHVWGVTMVNAIRMPVETDNNIVHHAITVHITRDL